MRRNDFQRSRVSLIRVGLLVFCVELSLAVLGLAIFSVFFSPHGVGPEGRDYVAFHAALTFLADGPGEAIRIYDEMLFAARLADLGYTGDGILAWLYPPIFLLVIYPLALLPPGLSSLNTGYALWALANGMAVASACWKAGLARGSAFLMLLFPGFINNAVTGQNAGLVAGLFGWGFLLLERRPVVAGICFGAAAFKPQLGILIPVLLIAGRHWRAFASAGATVLGLALLSGLVFGFGTWPAFLERLGWMAEAVEGGRQAQWKLVSTYAFVRQFGVSHQAASLVYGGVAAASAWMVYRIWRRRGAPLSRPVLAATLAIFLVTPYAFYYDLVLLALPLAVWIGERRFSEVGPKDMAVAGLLWLGPLVLWWLSVYTKVQVWAPVFLLGICLVAIEQRRRWEPAVRTYSAS
jgi:hypothetical protein